MPLPMQRLFNDEAQESTEPLRAREYIARQHSLELVADSRIGQTIRSTSRLRCSELHSCLPGIGSVYSNFCSAQSTVKHRKTLPPKSVKYQELRHAYFAYHRT